LHGNINADGCKLGIVVADMFW